ncbi:hypothetical protein I4U23_015287 [Adineta vaga]|nr:hypothetical protein I4U23_015287 [Adineta vaga]
MSIKSFENLSNEIFCEIFDYLDAYVIFHGFSNLNNRFRLLLNSSLTRLKVTDNYLRSKRIFLHNYKEIFLHHQHQIVSIHSWEPESSKLILSTITFDLSFQSLQTLAFNSIQPDILISLLQQLAFLPRLYSLTIDMWPAKQDLGYIYQLIFNLPQLKYLKYVTSETNEFNIITSLPMATEKQMTSIEYLIIIHPCSIKELFTILSYTPQLRHLKFLNVTDTTINLNTIGPISLMNLTKLSIEIYQLTFDELEILLKNLSLNLKILQLDINHEDSSYLDAIRWENFLRTNLVQLKSFYFKYIIHFAEDYATPMYLGEQNQFSSSFWIERQWIFKVENEFENLIYSIQPYKKKWYEYDMKSKDLSKSVTFDVSEATPERWTKTIYIHEYIHHALTVTKIYHLEISMIISLEQLTDILFQLPDVETLTLFRLSYKDSSQISDEEIQFLCLLFHKNRLTKIFLQEMGQMADVYFLALIASRVNHLHIKCKNYQHAESCIGLILTDIQSKSDSLLRLFSIVLPTIDNDTVKDLSKLVHRHNLLDNFMIEHVKNEIYLKWT